VTRRLRLAAFAAVTLAVVVSGWWLVEQGAAPGADVRDASFVSAVFLSFAVPALVAEWRRPGDALAWRTVVVGTTFALAYYRLFGPTWAAAAGAAVWLATPLAGLWLLGALTERRPRGRRAAAAWVAPAVAGAAVVLTSAPRHTTWGRIAGGTRPATWIHFDAVLNVWEHQGNPFVAWPSATAVRIAWAGWSVVVVGLAGVLVARLLRGRRMRLDGPGAAPAPALPFLTTATVAGLVGVLANVFMAWPERAPIADGLGDEVVARGSVVLGGWWGDLLVVAPAFAAAVTGGVLVWAELVRPRLSRATSGALELGADPSPGDLRAVVARGLGDPSVRIGYRDGAGGWVDERGRPFALAAHGGRAAAVVTNQGRGVAVIEHDGSLSLQPDLVEVVATSAALALEGQRLAALAAARAEDARESAARLLMAGDRARQALGRQIAEGPDRTLAVTGALLGERPVPYEEVHRGLRTAVAQVREIAHGLTPVSLAEEGLARALEDLSERSEVPVRLRAHPGGRLAPALEVTMYLTAADAAAHATHAVDLSVAVAPARSETDDDGGEATVALRLDGWTGPLDQLLADRVATLGGTVAILDGALVVRLPLARP
jgi:signal transduction histidine kinase